MTAPVYYFDIGNTRLKLWCCRQGRIEARWAAAHKGAPASLLRQLPEAFAERPHAVVGMSVLGGAADADFSSAVAQRWGIIPAYARATAEFRGLRNAYRDAPDRLGVDRWLGLIGAVGECDVICVVGCGTAVTIDLLRSGRHLGGYILPGLGLMEAALLQGTGRVRFDTAPPRTVEPGTDTATAVRNGALAAIVAMVERVATHQGVQRLILTGGDAEVVAGALSRPATVEPDLLLKGMMRYFDELPDVTDDLAPK